jgi:hypothetical protein
MAAIAYREALALSHVVPRCPGQLQGVTGEENFTHSDDDDDDDDYECLNFSSYGVMVTDRTAEVSGFDSPQW